MNETVSATQLDAHPASETDPRLFGEGPFPPELDVFNWNAFIWGGLWALVYGVWRWVGIFVALSIAGPFAYWAFRTTPLMPSSFAGVIVGVLAGLALNWSPRVLFAREANRLAWARAQRGSAARAGFQPAVLLLERFVDSQRQWAYFGAALWAVGLVAGLLTDRSPRVNPGWYFGGIVLGAVVFAVMLFGMVRERGGASARK